MQCRSPACVRLRTHTCYAGSHCMPKVTNTQLNTAYLPEPVKSGAGCSWQLQVSGTGQSVLAGVQSGQLTTALVCLIITSKSVSYTSPSAW